MRPRFALVGALACLLAISAACTGGGDDESAPKGSAGQPVEGGQQALGCDTIVASEDRRFRRPTESLIYLVDAVAESRACYDKITFTFDPADGDGLPPGYVVEYRKPPFVEGVTTSAEGFEPSKAYLYVELQPTSTVDRRFSGSGRLMYRGNQRLALDKKIRHANIVEWVKDFEDTTPVDPLDDKIIWIIGLDEKRPFTVDGASQPPHVSVLVMR
jgi:hypothetical protein